MSAHELFRREILNALTERLALRMLSMKGNWTRKSVNVQQHESFVTYESVRRYSNTA